ncbi:erythromycin esterase family protein [Alkalihalophilus pseudofirmus]|uniref:Erythromycin esterase family protein n=1 Tax=Alkalihalophilus pseudofirmus TaxID=79885 RepID=A0AAJ2NLT9_ALKPS|nr:erythromycin esterase family protein [Alkalihalophilus pseudofirmus]MDV2884928.1 erythromycin esterase family protein [Alkalihalophilus pseudofirmus]
MSFISQRTRNSWREEVKKAAFEINSSEDFSCIARYIKDKRIILLGENSHGIGNYFTTKTELIRYLHQHHGFNVVVLESGLLEATLCKEFLTNLSPDKQIQETLLDIYHNEEMKPLFQEEWAQSIKLSGMDPQPTYPLVSEYMVEWVKTHVDDELYHSMKKSEEQYFEFQDELLFKVTRSLKRKMKKSIQDYEELLDLLAIKQMREKTPEIQKMLLLIERGMQNRLQWLQVNLKGYVASGVQRGLHMFQNLEWLMNHYYKGEKIIVWAHNFHIRKKRPMIAKALGIKSVGYWLQKKYPEDIYTVGLYAGSGTFATQLRVNLNIYMKKKQYHLESLLYEVKEADLFLPLTGNEDQKWLRRRWRLLESGFSGLSPMVVQPQKHYDAIMFIREASPPAYLKRNECKA